MLLIIGLGNPEKQYDNTRHNVGFFMLDEIKEVWGFPDFKFNKKLNAEVSIFSLKNEKVILAKPQTFMNRSGEAVINLVNFYKLIPEDVIVIHDDKDIAIGKYKIAANSSSAGHNGVQDIIKRLETQKFKRIRIGIASSKSSSSVNASDFVLGKFKKEEGKIIDAVSQSVLEELKKLLFLQGSKRK